MYIIVTAFKSHEPETIEEIGTIGPFAGIVEANEYLAKDGLTTKPNYRWHTICNLVK
jgi:hypothetical protein